MMTTGRRTFLRSSTLAVTAAVISSTLEGMLTSQAKMQPSFSPSVVKALFFDVFGTLVDWRTGVSRDAKSILRPRGYAIDWKAFADAWRDEYQPGMEEVRSGRIPYSKLDLLHRRNLERILPRYQIKDLSEDALRDLNQAWH